MQTEVETMESETKDGPSFLERIEDLGERAARATPKIGTNSDILAFIAGSIGEARGYICGSGVLEREMAALGHILLNALEAVIVSAETHKDEDDDPDSRTSHREILLDVIKLATDENGEYDHAIIGDLQTRAGQLLVSG